MEFAPHITECGLPGIDQIPYGLHACHFYLDRRELVDALVPYFLAGLRNNERCLWITAPPLPAFEAIQALEAAWGEMRAALAKGALRIVDFDQWYATAARLKDSDLVQAWLDEEQRALSEGCSGLRITGNTSFLHTQDWEAFMQYERQVSSRFHGRRIVALCSYALDSCNPRQVVDVMRAHPCAFEHARGGWQVTSGRS